MVPELVATSPTPKQRNKEKHAKSPNSVAQVFTSTPHFTLFFFYCIIIGSEGSGQRNEIQRLRKDVQGLMQKASTALEINNISNLLSTLVATTG